MRYRMATGALCLAALLVTSVLADEALKSGPQVGSSKIPAFNPLHCNGSAEGQKVCLVWRNGGNPVAMIFAREVSDPLTSLVKKIDDATDKNKKAKMGSFVVFMNDKEDLKDQLKDLAKKEGLKHCILSIDNPAGPKGYDVSKESDITVVLYTSRNVKANYAFRKGELNEAAITKILADVPKILPKAKAK